MNIYEAHGRLVEAHQVLAQEYRNLLTLVAQIKSGDVDPDDVTVHLDQNPISWKITGATAEGCDPLAGRIGGNDGQVEKNADTG